MGRNNFYLVLNNDEICRHYTYQGQLIRYQPHTFHNMKTFFIYAFLEVVIINWFINALSYFYQCI
jgi:hypothetical protein